MARGDTIIPANVEAIAQVVGQHSHRLIRVEGEVTDLKKVVASSQSSRNVTLGAFLVLLINGILMYMLTAQMNALQRAVK